MNFPELGIKRYVMTFMVSFIIMICGILGYMLVGIAQQPDVDFPYITVTTTYQGTDALTMDDTVTTELLDNFNTISGIKNITSNSYEGRSTIYIEFELEKDIDVAFNEVQAKVNESLRTLPDGSDSPIIRKASNTGDSVFMLALGGNRTQLQLNDYVNDVIKKRLENISGVGEVDIRGSREQELRINLDTLKLSAHGMSVSQLVSAVQGNHYQRSAGYLVGSSQEFLLDLNFEAKTEDAARNIIIKNNNGSLVRLKDVAEVSKRLEDRRGFSFFNSDPSLVNSDPALVMALYKIPGANVFDIEKEVIKRLDEEIKPNLEPGLSLEIVRNSLDSIRALVSLLEEHLMLGTLFTSLVVILFLRNLTSTIIVAYSIPVSLLGAIFVIYIAGYTINSITLLALLILIGIVVDDTIIVLENIFTKMEKGVAPVKAAIDGTNQILFAVIATTLSLIAIFGPVIFMGGIIGKFFKVFAVVVTCGILISSLIAIYVTPMLCSRYIKISKKESKINNILESIFIGLENIYIKLLALALNARIIVVILALGFFLSSFFFASKIPGEFSPEADDSQFRINVSAPMGSSSSYSLVKAKEVESILKQYDEIKSYTLHASGSSVNKVRFYVNMLGLDERDISKEDFIKKVQKDVSKIRGVRISVSGTSGWGGYRLEFALTTTEGINDLYAQAISLEQKLLNAPEIAGVNLDMEMLPQIGFKPNYEKISLLGLNVSEVAQAIGASVGGITIGKYSEATDTSRYDINLESNLNDFSNINDLNNIFLSLGDNQIVRLDNVVEPYEYLNVYNVQRRSGLYNAPFGIVPSGESEDAIAAINRITQESLPIGYNIQYTGMQEAFQETIMYVVTTFILALILLYAVLASQFNSFIQPIVLMMSIPLAITGAMISLYLGNSSINIYSMIGLILLIGLVVKNSILLIDFTNETRKEGKSIRESLMISCPRRLRPVLMTSLTVIVTMIPAAIMKGEGSENNSSLALAVVGGMLSSTFLTLIVIPAIYSLVEEFLEKVNKKDKVVLEIDE